MRVRTYAADLVHATALFVLVAVCTSLFWAVAPLVVGMRSSVIMSGSMTPGIRPGDVVVSVPTPADDLRPGMVISFTDPDDPGRTLVHRFDAVNADGTVRTKGDANAEPDSTPVTAGLIDGQSRIRIPYVGLPAYWLRTGAYGRPVLAAALVVVAMVLVTGRRFPDQRPATIGRHRAAPGRHQGRRRLATA